MVQGERHVDTIDIKYCVLTISPFRDQALSESIDSFPLNSITTEKQLHKNTHKNSQLS